MRCRECGHENGEGGQFCSRCGSPLVSDEDHSRSHAQETIGKYQLIEEIGRGAMARVWRAYDRALDREVAVKVPLFDEHIDQGFREELGMRFVEEAHIAARLNHPNIVTIYAADMFDGTPAIIMELIDGMTLSDLLESGPVDPDFARSILNELLDAVGYAHSCGIVHRDIKPDNVFIDRSNHVKLADFGIARLAEPGRQRKTMIGTVMGTPGYMSPEQAKGVREVDERSDLFSVGVIGYEMLTGRNPFGADRTSDSTTLLYRIVHEPVEDPSALMGGTLPESMRISILAALEKDPNNRPQSAAEFKAMLNGGLHAVSGEDFKEPAKKRKWLPYVIVCAIGVIALIVVLVNAMSGASGGAGVAASTNTSAQATQDSGSSASGGQTSDGQTSNEKASGAQASDAQASQKAHTPPEFDDAVASSELVPDEKSTYYATHVLNDNFETSWNEGVDGEGIGEWIELRASSPQLVKGVRIINGYPNPKSVNNFYNNNRARVLHVELSDGYSTDITLADDYSLQSFDFGGEHVTNSVKLTIKDVYFGEVFNDTCLTYVSAF